MARSRSRRLWMWLLGAVVALAVLVTGGTWLYIHVFQGPAPAPLSLKSPASSQPSATATTAPGSDSNSGSATATRGGAIAGSWRVASGSVVGYRVNEVLAGQNNVAVGRTSGITGSMTIHGARVTAASFTVQMATIKSDQSERDAQFDGRIMDTAAFPAGTLKLTSPIALGSLPRAGVVKSYRVTADLTLHGHTRAVAFTLQAERTSAGIEVSGSIPIVFADWGISNPSFAGFVTTQNHRLLEFLVKFSKS